jgi:hypothetical protein
LFAQPAIADFAASPHLLLQKFPARQFTVETRVELPPTANGAAAGLVVVGGNHAALLVESSPTGGVLEFGVDNVARQRVPIMHATARLFVDVHDGGLCSFRYSLDGDAQPVTVGEPFQAVQGHWIGARVGLSCSTTGSPSKGMYADFEHFTFSSLSEFIDD